MQIGNKLKRLRLESGMTQEEIADRCELTKGYISQLERELTSPSISTLEDILECLGTSLQEFFGKEEEDEQVAFSEANYFVKEYPEDGYAINWIVPNAKKRTMEPILAEIKPNCTMEDKDPHSGEEFGMVLNGTVFLTLGKERFRLKKGDCFQFKPNKYHSLKNAGKTVAKILWITSPPSF